MIADRGGPCAAAVQRLVIGVKGHFVPDIVDDFPVHQVPGMQQGNCRSIAETGGNHKIVLSHPNGIRVGIIRIKNRVFVSPVPLICNPHFFDLAFIHSFLLSRGSLEPPFRMFPTSTQSSDESPAALSVQISALLQEHAVLEFPPPRRLFQPNYGISIAYFSFSYNTHRQSCPFFTHIEPVTDRS